MASDGIERKLGLVAAALVSLDVAVKVFPYRWRHAQSLPPEEAKQFAQDVERVGAEAIAKALGTFAQ